MSEINSVPLLSAHDEAVLNTVFDPTQSGGTLDTKLDEYFGNEVLPNETPKTVDEPNAANEESERFETAGLLAAEGGDLPKAIGDFTQAIAVAPHRPSPWNNRAQVYRLLDTESGDAASLKDLEETLRLTRTCRTACRAYCQRGLIHRKQNDLEAARSDFNEAAKLGSQFARNQLIAINPYAAMCNQMLHQVFDKLK